MAKKIWESNYAKHEGIIKIYSKSKSTVQMTATYHILGGTNPQWRPYRKY